MYRFANEIVKRLPAPLLRWNWLRLSSTALHFFLYVRKWLEADEFPETEALIAAVDQGFRLSQSGKGISIEEARELVRKCATRSA